MRPIHILLIEDNDGDVLLFKESFEDAGIKTCMEVLMEGKIAIDHLQDLLQKTNLPYPDLIFLDINLPKRNGHEVLAFLNATEGLNKIPVVILSTSSWNKDIEKAYEAGAMMFMSKPFDLNQFLGFMEGNRQLGMLLQMNQP